MTRTMTTTALAYLCLVSLAVLCVWGVRAEYEEALARMALNFARAAQCDTDGIRKWNCDACSLQSFSVHQVHSNETHGTRVYTGIGSNHIVVAIGAEENPNKLVPDLDTFRIPFRTLNCVDCTAHRDFMEQYAPLRSNIIWKFREFMDAHPNVPLLVTGHGIGGALATLAATDLASLPPQAFKAKVTPRVKLYTFGAPAVGNKALADWTGNVFCKGTHTFYRVVHSRDAVPAILSPEKGYSHAGQKVWYDGAAKHAEFKVCATATTDTCVAMGSQGNEQCGIDTNVKSDARGHRRYLGTCTRCWCRESTYQ